MAAPIIVSGKNLHARAGPTLSLVLRIEEFEFTERTNLIDKTCSDSGGIEEWEEGIVGADFSFSGSMDVTLQPFTLFVATTGTPGIRVKVWPYGTVLYPESWVDMYCKFDRKSSSMRVKDKITFNCSGKANQWVCSGL